MKRLLINSILVIAAILILSSNSNLLAQVPAPARWLQQINSEYDSTTKVFTIVLEWKNGLIDAEHPEAVGYNVYRSMIGHNQALEEYDFVGSIASEDMQDGKYTFKDDIEFEGAYLYYVRGIYNDNLGELSPTTQAFSRSSYCVNMSGEIVDFKSFPVTVAMPGEQYTYQAFAKHRSLRVQGWVRYHLVEGPEGMSIDNLKGTMTWTPPTDAEGNYYVKIRATSDEDSRAESIQEWYIRIANHDEIISSSTNVSEVKIDNNLLIMPCPANNQVSIDYNAIGKIIQIEIVSLDGQIIKTDNMQTLSDSNTLNISTTDLSNGSYFIRIIDGNTITTGKLIISK